MNRVLTPLKIKHSSFYTKSNSDLPIAFSQITPEKTICYPESDGKPMSDNTKQFNWIVKIKEGFELLFADNPDVFVAGDLLWYPVEGNNKIRVAPDTMIVFGRPKGDRGSYRNWDEDNIGPQIVFEILSPGNTKKEMIQKLKFYEQYKVEEYYIYDPYKITFSIYIRSGMKLGFINNIHSWISPRLKVRFEINKQTLKILDPNNQEFISPLEMSLERNAERKRAETERKRAETERKRAETERKRAEGEHKRAESECKRAEKISLERDAEYRRAEKISLERDAEYRRAETERKKAEKIALERDIAHKRAELLADKLKKLGIIV